MTDEFPPGYTAEEIEQLRRSAKEALRHRVAALRRALPATTRADRARAMCERLTSHEAFVNARVIAAYAALRFEIDPFAAIENAWSTGKTVALPRALSDGAIMLHQYSRGDDLFESGFMVREPTESAPEVDPATADLVLVPGLAFDTRGHRLGYGQGYYDRLLPRLNRAVRIGLAFEPQLLAEVPNSEHDVPVDWLVTDRRVLRCER